MTNAPTLLWFRHDLRLSDHEALTAAAARGCVIPVFIYDSAVEQFGAAAKQRLEAALTAFAKHLEAKGLRLILRKGDAETVLKALIGETGADAVYWSRHYDAQSIARDTGVKAALEAKGVEAHSFRGRLLHEPWAVETKTGGPYRVYSPYWRAVAPREISATLPEPALTPPASWPQSDALSDWALSSGMNRGAPVLAEFISAGETAAHDRLGAFIENGLRDYKTARDIPAADGTSGLSDALAWGEISPRQIWNAVVFAEDRTGQSFETYRKEIVWREFAWHLLYHFPDMDHANFKPEWTAFPWREDAEDPAFQAWCQGRTGQDFVDAGMRELWITGKMHNRVRMIVASYLTKNLGFHWRLGLKWFQDTLIDWDPASNAMGWQWVAGSGPDAAPYFRIFNPETQGEKFDPKGLYRKRYLAEYAVPPSPTALKFYDAAKESWGRAPTDRSPAPLVDLAASRKRALARYETLKSEREA